VIPNNKLLAAFRFADDILRQGVQGITIPGLVNVDFADVRAVMADAGSALMGDWSWFCEKPRQLFPRPY